ncbi:MAG TPA: phosphatidate cytidylyltransferase [Dissulfurispiraceae bacterium]|nr:phosphatidate cytidylyltransferase [Dissulfurispiraceae bacterium]
MFDTAHLKRVAVALIMLPLFYYYVAKLSPFYFLFLLLLASFLAQAEFYSMYKTDRLLSLSGMIGGILTLGSPFLSMFFSGVVSSISIQTCAFILAFMLIALVRLFRKGPLASLKEMAPVVVGIFYIPNLLIAQWYLRLKGYEWILFLYGCVYAADSMAYYVGKGLGKRKLYSAVSPNKTIAGAVGSVAGGVMAALILGTLLLDHHGMFELFIMGGVVGTVTIAGDLVESMFKRDANIKDSGSLIPGHGGILDKIDGALFAGPVLYWITLLL